MPANFKTVCGAVRAVPGGFDSHPSPLCHVSGDSGPLSQLIGDHFRADRGLVAASRVEDELTQEGSVVAADADVGAGDEEEDRCPTVGSADIDMTELAEQAQADLAVGVDPVTS